MFALNFYGVIDPINEWQENMQHNFLINQQTFLNAQSIDINLKKGVCAAMVVKWLTRELAGKSQDFLYYKNVYKFASYQRALEYRCHIKNTANIEFKSDRHVSLSNAPIYSAHFSCNIPTSKPGAYLIQIYSPWGWMHCIGLHISNGVYKLFDPSYGEFELINKHSHTQALLECQKHIFQYYPALNIPYMKITELRKKS